MTLEIKKSSIFRNFWILNKIREISEKAKWGDGEPPHINKEWLENKESELVNMKLNKENLEVIKICYL